MLQNCHLIAGVRISSFPGNAKIGSKAHRLRKILQSEKNASLFEQLHRVEKAGAGRKPKKGETQADRIRRFRQQQRPVLASGSISRQPSGREMPRDTNTS